MIRVLLAIKHRMCSEAVAMVLSKEQDLKIVAVASNGPEVLQKIAKTKPDAAVLAWFLPLLNGLETTRRIATLGTRPHVILLTDGDTHITGVQELRAGVRALVSFQTPVSDLPNIIRQVAGGFTFLGLNSSALLAAAILDPHPRRGLSARERQVLQLTAEGHSIKQTGAILGISFKTANYHRTSLMKKLDIQDVATLTRYAIRERIIDL